MVGIFQAEILTFKFLASIWVQHVEFKVVELVKASD